MVIWVYRGFTKLYTYTPYTLAKHSFPVRNGIILLIYNLFRINMKSGNFLFLTWKQKVSPEKQTVSTAETM